MTIKDKALLPWKYFFGKESDINLFGTITLSPLIILICIIYSAFELLFSKDD